jgi:hypothetical protein
MLYYVEKQGNTRVLILAFSSDKCFIVFTFANS